MKFVIQKIENQIRHDFSFTLLESMRFYNWIRRGEGHTFARYVNTKYDSKGILQDPEFKKYHRSYIPIGSVEFVAQHLQEFHGLYPKPINVPEELKQHAGRPIFEGTNINLDLLKGKWFVKSHDKIKGLTKIVDCPDILSVPPGGNERYQISKYININSEWRVFVYKGKMVGLQHYIGEFTLFPDVTKIKRMIEDYKDCPISYTLDIGINDEGTFVIEVHDFFSCGLYGFSNNAILPQMFGRWYTEYVNKNKHGNRN